MPAPLTTPPTTTPPLTTPPTTTPPTTAPPAPARSTRRVAAGAVGAGVALGVGDLLLQVGLPYPWANLANSAAVWTVAVIAFGAWARGPLLRAGAAGAGLLVLAVVSYYLAAAVLRGDDLATVWSPASLTWAAFGVVVGAVATPLGTWARRPGFRGVVAAAATGAICVAEAAVDLTRLGEAGRDDADSIGTAVLLSVLGVVALAVTAPRGTSALGRALLLAVPLAALALGGYVLAGFTG